MILCFIYIYIYKQRYRRREGGGGRQDGLICMQFAGRENEEVILFIQHNINII